MSSPPQAAAARRLPARIVAATHNAGKLREIRELLAPHGVDAVGAAETEPQRARGDRSSRSGTTLRSRPRRRRRLRASPRSPTTSGLCVDALGGAPGVYSARWAGDSRDFRAAMARIERELRAAGAPQPWRAHFVSVLALAWPDGRTETFEGRVDGDLVFPPRGTAGFGYDPIFRPDGHARTFGEMSAEEKHGIPSDGSLALSHRARAFQKFARARL